MFVKTLKTDVCNLLAVPRQWGEYAILSGRARRTRDGVIRNRPENIPL